MDGSSVSMPGMASRHPSRAELLKRRDNELKHLFGQSRIDTHPEYLSHDEIGVGQLADRAHVDVEVSRLAKEVPAEEQTRGDPLRFKVPNKILPAERGIGPHSDRETKPARVRVGRRFRKHEELFQILQPVVEETKVVPPRRYEAGELPHLRQPHRRLHVCSFEVVAYVRVDVLVVEPSGKLAELPIEPLTARVFLPRVAPAIAPPVAKALDQRLQPRTIRHDAAAFAHGDMVGGI